MYDVDWCSASWLAGIQPAKEFDNAGRLCRLHVLRTARGTGQQELLEEEGYGITAGC